MYFPAKLNMTSCPFNIMFDKIIIIILYLRTVEEVFIGKSI